MLGGGVLSLPDAAAAEAADLAAGINCPVQETNLVTGSTGASGQLNFYNRDSERAVLFWVDPEGSEQLLGPIERGGSKSMNSFSGHAFRARRESDSAVLFEVLVGDEHRDFHIGPCAQEKARDVSGDHEWLQEHGSRSDPSLAGCPLSALLSEQPVLGFHVVCVVVDAGGLAERVCAFENGHDAPRCSHSARVVGNATIAQLTKQVSAMMRPGWAPLAGAPVPAMFTASGRRLPGNLNLPQVGVPEYRRVLVFIEGGEWHWPPVRVGFERALPFVESTREERIVLRTLALQPRIFEVKSFIEEAECDRMLEKAGPHVAKSQVSLKDHDVGKDVDTWRTSFNYFLPSRGDSVLKALDERVQNLTRISISNSEEAQILKYEYMGRYSSHTDFFDPADYKRDPQTMRLIGNGLYNRLLTVFMYMSNVEEGGETIFPKEGGKPTPSDYGDCSRGYKVKPERRKVIIFYSMHPNGALDPNSLHGSCPVVNGTKWSANYWVWNTERAFKQGQEYAVIASRLSAWERDRDFAEEQAFMALSAREDAVSAAAKAAGGGRARASGEL